MAGSGTKRIHLVTKNSIKVASYRIAVRFESQNMQWNIDLTKMLKYYPGSSFKRTPCNGEAPFVRNFRFVRIEPGLHENFQKLSGHPYLTFFLLKNVKIAANGKEIVQEMRNKHVTVATIDRQFYWTYLYYQIVCLAFVRALTWMQLTTPC